MVRARAGTAMVGDTARRGAAGEVAAPGKAPLTSPGAWVPGAGAGVGGATSTVAPTEATEGAADDVQEGTETVGATRAAEAGEAGNGALAPPADSGDLAPAAPFTGLEAKTMEGDAALLVTGYHWGLVKQGTEPARAAHWVWHTMWQ